MKMKLLLGGVFLAAFSLNGFSFEVASQGRAAAEILIDPAAHPAVRNAAEELSLFCGKICGNAPAVKNIPEAGNDFSGKIVIVTPEARCWKSLVKAFPDFAADMKKLQDNDGYAVRTRGKNLYLFAGNPKGCLNGVYRLLQKNTDIIWPRPAGGAVMFTGNPDLAFAENDYIDIPTFPLRHFGGSGTVNRELLVYLTRNASNPRANLMEVTDKKRKEWTRWGAIQTYADIFGSGHNMVRYWFPQEEFYAAHPEYYMLVDGRRYNEKDQICNLCETNPEMIRAYCRSVEEKLKRIPKSVRIVEILMEDTRKTCTCEKCLAPIRLPDGTLLDKNHEAFRPTRFFLFFNQVARHVEKVRPGTVIRQFAYLHLAIPPKIPIEKNILVAWCPYPRNMKESVVEGVSNREWRKRLDGWLSITSNLYFREYYFCGCIYYPRPIADTAAVDLRYIAKHGVKVVYTDNAGAFDTPSRINFLPGYKHEMMNQPYSEFWDLCAPEAWCIQQLFWNPEQNPVELRREFLRRTFREAAPEMIRFYELLRKSWYSDHMPSTFKDNAYKSAACYIVEKKIDKQCLALLEKAEGKTDNAEIRAWIKAIHAKIQKFIDGASVHLTGNINVPFAVCDTFPGFDLEKGVWEKAVTFPDLLRVHTREKNPDKTILKIFNDGSSFYVGMYAKKDPKALFVQKGVTERKFPSGDRLELFFAPWGSFYYHFAGNRTGDTYEAKGRDYSWTRDWIFRSQTVSDGWQAVVKIPFQSIGFNPVRNNKLRFMPMIAYYYGRKQGKGKIGFFSWNGGISHAPYNWGELTVNLK